MGIFYLRTCLHDVSAEVFAILTNKLRKRPGTALNAMEFTRISSTNIFCNSAMAPCHPSPPAMAAVVITTLLRRRCAGSMANKDRAKGHWWHRAHREIWAAKSLVETCNAENVSRLDAQLEVWIMADLARSGCEIVRIFF